MTREQAREAAAVMLGWADGKEVEVCRKRTGKWGITDDPIFNLESYDYRLKPTATLRPWTADEVPLGAWLRFKHNPKDRTLLGWVSVQADRDLWLEEREHSTDGGLTWKPCGVEEVGK